MYSTHYNSIFCDWLSITFAPEDNPYPELNRFLIDLGYKSYEKSSFRSIYSYDPERVIRDRVTQTDKRGLTTVVPKTHRLSQPADVPPELFGTVMLSKGDRFINFQFKGMFLHHMRSLGIQEYLLAILSRHPYSIPRLDLAVDTTRPFKSVYNNARRRYKSGHYTHGRLKMPVSYKIGFPDKIPEGTIYVGGIKQDVHGKIYDKTAQMTEHYHLGIDPDVVRYEMTYLKRIGATLRDVSEPDLLFNAHCAVLGLKPDTGLPRWHSGAEYVAPTLPPLEPLSPFYRLQKLIDTDSAFTTMLDLADDLGEEGRTTLLRLLRDKILS